MLLDSALIEFGALVRHSQGGRVDLGHYVSGFMGQAKEGVQYLKLPVDTI